MCIAVISSAHPSYPLILLDNRDEFLNRPTAPAKWWDPPNSHVFAGQDLLRSAHGTWMGVTKHGKIAVLTNFREDTTPAPSAVSRGAIIRKFLTEHTKSTTEFVKSVVNTGIARDAGGFSLICGRVDEKLAVISNRADSDADIPWIAGDVVQTVALSNAAFTDRGWKKVSLGEELTLNAIRESMQKNETEDELIQRFLQVLNTDTLPRHRQDGGLDAYIHELQESIFVPPLGRENLSAVPADEVAAARMHEKAMLLDQGGHVETVELGVSGPYGTQKQTVILVDKESNLRFFERTLYDGKTNRVPQGQGDVDLKFKIESI